MADQPVVHIGENSPEQVAYRLLRDIMMSEQKSLKDVDRNYLLDTYSECWRAVRGN